MIRTRGVPSIGSSERSVINLIRGSEADLSPSLSWGAHIAATVDGKLWSSNSGFGIECGKGGCEEIEIGLLDGVSEAISVH